MKNFVEELQWRGMLHQSTPGAEAQLQKELTRGYIGFDPTADSLGIGNMVQVMTLVHFQRCGHKPIALVGGATGMVGDPSGKSNERNLLDAETLQRNLDGQRKQLEKFLDFDCGENSAEIVNNYDWFKEFGFLEFIRDVGKHLTVNYMMAKDSVKKRIAGENVEGMSFTEFSYQLVQGYDFVHLNREMDCKVQLGGSDQWGNITTGTELIRKLGGGEAYAVTTPLITKADGTKFGKTESGNIWLDPARTSPYAFYQFWLNAADADVTKYIRIFSTKTREEIEALEAEHAENPGARLLQKTLAEEITTRVHSAEDFRLAKEASELLFAKGADALQKLGGLPEKQLQDVIDSADSVAVNRAELEEGVNIIDFLSTSTGIVNSKGEARRALKGNAVSVNRAKVKEDFTVSVSDLISEKFLLVQNGKKKQYFVVLN